MPTVGHPIDEEESMKRRAFVTLPAVALAAGQIPASPGAAAADAPAFALSGAGTLVLAAPGAHAIDVMLEWQHELRRLVPAPQPALPR